MIILVIVLFVGFGLAILPAIRHDRGKFHRHTDPACCFYRYREPRNPISRYLDRRARGKSCLVCMPPAPYHTLHRPESNCPECEDQS